MIGATTVEGLAARVRRQWVRSRSGYLFILPSLAVFITFMIAPMIYGLFISLHRWSVLSSPVFNGLDNYGQFVRDPEFWKALRITAIYTVMYVPSITMSAFLVAIGLNGNIRFKGLFRSLYFVPVMSSSIIVSLCFKWIYDGDVGILNAVIEFLGLGKIIWLGTARTVLPSLAGMAVWWALGYYMTIYLAGLQSVPAHLFEAAKIDGANAVQMVRHIVMPLLRPIILLVVVLATIGSFQVFDAIFVMTNGGPAGGSSTLTWMIYHLAFMRFNMGYAAGVAYALFAIVLVISLVQMRLLRTTYEY